MNIYPNLRIDTDGFEHEKDDGRISSRAEDGTARAEIPFDELQHKFTIKHVMLDENERDIVDQFYDVNAALEFTYDCPFNRKRYRCIFLTPPQPTDHVGFFCSMVVEFTGSEIRDGN